MSLEEVDLVLLPVINAFPEPPLEIVILALESLKTPRLPPGVDELEDLDGL